MFCHDCPPSGETCKHATAPSTKKTWRDSLSIDVLLSAVSVLVVAQSSSEIPEGTTNALAWNAKASILDKLMEQWQVTCHKTHINTFAASYLNTQG
jgi:hypothetical protein